MITTPLELQQLIDDATHLHFAIADAWQCINGNPDDLNAMECALDGIEDDLLFHFRPPSGPEDWDEDIPF